MARKVEPGKEVLVYEPSSVSWAVAEAVARPPAVLSRLGLYAILLIVAAAFAYAYLTTISITVAGRGTIRTSGKVLPVRAQTTGKVAQLGVANGRRVKKGQALMDMEDALDPKEQDRARGIITSVRRILAAGATREAMVDVGVVAQEPLRMTGSILVRERTSLGQALNDYFQALRALHEATPQLTRADVIERQNAEEKIGKIHRQHLEEELRTELQDLEKSVYRFGVSIRDRQEQARRSLASARTTLEVQLKTFEEALRSQTESLRVVAPIDGIVSALAVAGPGELVQSGQTLFQIIPDGGKLMAEVQIANKDIADLRIGMPVQLKLDAYPYQDYGTLPGVLTELPEDVTQSDKNAPPTYVVLIAPRRDDLDLDGHSNPLKLGMTLDADIEVRHRTLLELAIIEVLKLKDLL